MQRRLIRSLPLGALVFGAIAVAPFALGGCDKKAGDLVRPEERTANDAMGEGTCDEEAIKADANPLVVDWSDSDRAALESEMSKGVALVEYTCDGVKVLKGCAVEGVYSYAGVSRKTKVISMEDMSSVRANLTAGKLPAEVKAELDRGATLDLAYVLVGTESTTVSTVVRGDLPAERCKSATHFVYDAQVGAFAMETGAAGQAKAAVDILGRGASAGTASSKATRTTDGDPGACEGAGSSTPAAVDGCQALLRVTLFPIETGDTSVAATSVKKKGSIDGRGGCPDGFKYVDGACEKADKVKHYLCEKGNADECKAQCDKGSMESCGRLANHILSDMMEEDEAAVMPLIMDVRDKYAQACAEAGEADACTLAGFAILIDFANEGENIDPATLEPRVKNMAKFLEAGCRGGESYSCELMADTYLEGSFDPMVPKDVSRYYDIVEQSCHAGAAASCGIASREFAFGSHMNVDLEKATEYGVLGCYGGVATDCVMVGSIVLGSDFCGQMMQAYQQDATAAGASAENTHLFSDAEINAMCKAAPAGAPTPESLTAASEWYGRGCDFGDQVSCTIVEALKG